MAKKDGNKRESVKKITTIGHSSYSRIKKARDKKRGTKRYRGQGKN